MKAGKIRQFILIPLLVIALTITSVSALADDFITEETGQNENAEVINETETETPTPDQDETPGADELSSEEEGISDDASKTSSGDGKNTDTDENDTEESSDVNEIEQPVETTEEGAQNVTEEEITSEETDPSRTEEERPAEEETDTEENVMEEASEDTDEDALNTEAEEQGEDSVKDGSGDSDTDEESVEEPEETIAETKPAKAKEESENETVEPQKPTVESFYLGEMDGSGNFSFFAKGISSLSGIKKVRVLVWCRNDKSDKHWYTLKNGEALCNISNHQYHFGTYKAKLFVYDTNGKTWYIGLCTKKHEKISATAKSVSMVPCSNTSKRFKIKAVDVQSPKGIKQVKALVWSESDKSNKKWYTNFESDGSGNYTGTGSFYFQKHKEGTYHVKLYVVDNTGAKTAVASTTKKIKVSCESISTSFSSVTLKETFKLTGLKSYGLIDHVEYAVWREGNNQKDLKWFKAEKGDGDFACKVNMATSFGKNGTYNVHCYAVTLDGVNKYIAGKTFKVKGIPTAAECTLERISNSKVKLNVKYANVKGVPAESVRFAVWSNATGVGNSSAQDDIVWYDAVQNVDGSFSCTVNRTKHLSSGKYTAHVYAYAGSKNACCTGKEFTLYKTASFAGKYATVARNCILAVETGGQVYGNARYNDFTEAFHISAAETGITIGAGQWMGYNAVKLLMEIRSANKTQFKKLDTGGISTDLDNLKKMGEAYWPYYGGSESVGGIIKSGSKKAKAIQKVISSSTGIAVQNTTVENNIAVYVAKAKELGVKDIDAQIFMANVCHLGGSGAMSRIISNTKAAGLQLTMENLWSVMQQDVGDTSSSNQVGDTIYQSRHLKIIGWIYQYLN